MNNDVITPLTVRMDSRYVQQVYRWPGCEPNAQPIWDLDGVAWYDADPPPWWHQHWPHTVGVVGGLGGETWRCPCGAIGGMFERWVLLERRRWRGLFRRSR